MRKLGLMALILARGFMRPTAQTSIASGSSSPALVGFCVSSGQRWIASGEGVVHPWAAAVDGVADALFAEGRRGIMTAESDFHQRKIEGRTAFWPGEFSKTYVFCPERSEAGAFAGLRSGASYFVVGNIIENLKFSASADGERVMMGEELTVTDGADIDVTVESAGNSILDSLELIGNPAGAARMLVSASSEDLIRKDGIVRWTVKVDAPPGNFFLRLRGSGPLAEPISAAGCFYTSPLWVDTS